MSSLLYKIAGGIALLWIAYGLGYGTCAYKAGLEDAVRAGQQKEVNAANVKALELREAQKRESDEATKQVLAWGVSERERLAARVKRLQQQTGEGSGVPIVPGTDGSLEACQQRLDDIAGRAERSNAALERINREVPACVAEVIRLGECQGYLTQCQNRR